MARRAMTHPVRPQGEDLQLLIGRRLRAIRRARRLSQSQLGSALGLSGLRIHRYEAGRSVLKAAVLWRLCQQLEVDVDEFFADPAAPGASGASPPA